MDDQRFDNLARSLARGGSRRGVLKGLFGVAAGALGIAVARPALAIPTPPPNPRARPAGATCVRSSNCASGVCDFQTRKCACPVETVACGGACVPPCKTGTLDPVTCACCVTGGGPCFDDGDCCSGVCDETTSTCIAAGSLVLGATCEFAADCTSGSCEGNVCCQADGASCAVGSDCCGGTCDPTSGICGDPVVTGCVTSTDCTDPNLPVCDPDTNVCVECIQVADCVTGEVCTANVCTVPCVGPAGFCTISADCCAPLVCSANFCTGTGT